MKDETRVVLLSGAFSLLLVGDPDKQRYGNEALPKLIADGWEIVGSPTPAENAMSYVTVRRHRPT